MSLGFLTESALLPSKAKEIKVDSKSLLDLKAVVFKKEQERKERKRRLVDALEGGGDKTQDGKGRGRRRETSQHAGDPHDAGKDVYARNKARQKQSKGKREQNRGVEARRARDEEERELDVNNDDDDEALQRKSREMLEKKAKMYEDMMNGKRADVPSAAVKECLVDFAEKRRSSGAVAVVTDSDQNGLEMITLIHEFGRTRSVVKGSREHLEIASATHQAEALFYEDKRQAAPEASQRSEPPTGSFVVSQWEKTLKNDEKEYLKQVHVGVELAKKTQGVDRHTRKQMRLAKLREQQQGVTDANTTTPASMSIMEEKKAAEKASAFLNELSTLM